MRAERGGERRPSGTSACLGLAVPQQRPQRRPRPFGTILAIASHPAYVAPVGAAAERIAGGNAAALALLALCECEADLLGHRAAEYFSSFAIASSRARAAEYRRFVAIAMRGARDRADLHAAALLLHAARDPDTAELLGRRSEVAAFIAHPTAALHFFDGDAGALLSALGGGPEAERLRAFAREDDEAVAQRLRNALPDAERQRAIERDDDEAATRRLLDAIDRSNSGQSRGGRAKRRSAPPVLTIVDPATAAATRAKIRRRLDAAAARSERSAW